MSDRAGPIIGVLALQGDVREHLAALRRSGARGVPVRRASELDEVDGLVLPGGESTTIVKLALAFDLLDPLRKRIRDGLPTYGSCAGMILLADRILDGTSDQETIGGIDMTVRRNAFGRQVDSFEEPITLDGVSGPPFHAVFIRAPWVETVGAQVQLLGRVPTGRHPMPSSTPAGPGSADAGGVEGRAYAGRIIAVRQGHLLATSFHPELSGDSRVHALFVQIVREQS